MKTKIETEQQYYQDQFGKIDSTTAKIKVRDSNGAETNWMNLAGYEAIESTCRFTRKARGYTPKVGVIEVKFLGPTNYKGSRVKISCSDLRHRNNNKAKSKIFSVDYQFNNILNQAEKILTQFGFSIIGVNEQESHYLLIVEWNSEQVAAFFGIELE